MKLQRESGMKSIWSKIPVQVGWIGQFGGLIVISLLLYLEVKYGAHIYLRLGTGFSLIWAISTKIAHARRK